MLERTLRLLRQTSVLVAHAEEADGRRLLLKLGNGEEHLKLAGAFAPEVIRRGRNFAYHAHSGG
jgi:hypothetical protein